MRTHSTLTLVALFASSGAFTSACGGEPNDLSGTGGQITGGSQGVGGSSATGGSATGGSATGGSATGGSALGAGGSAPGTGGTAMGAGGGVGSGGSGGSEGAGGVVGGGGGDAPSGGAGTGGEGTGGAGMMTGGYPEFPGAACDAPHGEYGAIDNPKLPNPFLMHNGDVIGTKAEWECRRAQIIHDLEEFEVGPKPPPPQVEATLSGQSLSVKVTTDAGTMTLTSNISGSGSCVAIGVDGPSSMIDGCTNVPFSANQVARQGTTGHAYENDGYYQVYPELWEPAGDGNAAVGNYSAWSWGVSRLIDGLDQVKDQLGIDVTKIGIHGCSWAGKLALWAGALDARIALTVAQESGGGGAAAWRISEDYEEATGNQVEDLDNTGWAWFLDWLVEPYIESGGGGKNPHLLPHDHHELVALIAPRALILLPGDPGNTHLAPHSAYASFHAAKRVWRALGVDDHAGVVGHDQGGGHCAASSSQSQAVDAFVNRFLKGGGGDTNFDKGVDYNGESYVDWDAHTLE